MNSIMRVNQAACVILMSDKLASQLGVSYSKIVHLLGCASAIEPGYFVSVRPQLGTSYGMIESIESALKQAKCKPNDIGVFDLYSCFPVAVNVACDALGIDPLKDHRSISVTGGLPYYGGPGNAYALCSIAAMVEKLRDGPFDQVGLVNGNGWFLSKHSCGVYSRKAPAQNSGPWIREDIKVVQERANARAGPLLEVALNPQGDGVVESYTVDFSNKKKPPCVFVIGRMINGTDQGKRFIASCSNDIQPWMARDGIGLVVRVTPANGKNSCQIKDTSDWEKQPLSGIKIATSATTKQSSTHTARL
jgi:acetyl-CoA C-acetyltransferase